MEEGAEQKVKPERRQQKAMKSKASTGGERHSSTGKDGGDKANLKIHARKKVRKGSRFK